MMAERGLSMAHATFMCWLQRYPPEIEKRWRQFAHHGGMDEIGEVLGRRRRPRARPRVQRPLHQTARETRPAAALPGATFASPYVLCRRPGATSILNHRRRK
jgi:hypothetical protein